METSEQLELWEYATQGEYLSGDPESVLEQVGLDVYSTDAAIDEASCFLEDLASEEGVLILRGGPTFREIIVTAIERTAQDAHDNRRARHRRRAA